MKFKFISVLKKNYSAAYKNILASILYLILKRDFCHVNNNNIAMTGHAILLEYNIKCIIFTS